jgi:tetratricopeptide (TPR) repeat protein
VPPSLIIVLVGVLFLAGFSGLTLARRQKPSLRFLIEGGIITALGVAAVLAGVALNPILFLVILYLLTLRVRLFVDAGNLLTARRKYNAALSLFRLALRLGPDAASRQIVLINRGVTQLRMGEAESAYFSLKAVLLDEEARLAARYLAAGYYNLGVACLRTGRQPEAVSHFRKAVEILPGSIYAYAAEQALKRGEADTRKP